MIIEEYKINVKGVPQGTVSKDSLAIWQFSDTNSFSSETSNFTFLYLWVIFLCFRCSAELTAAININPRPRVHGQYDAQIPTATRWRHPLRLRNVGLSRSSERRRTQHTGRYFTRTVECDAALEHKNQVVLQVEMVIPFGSVTLLVSWYHDQRKRTLVLYAEWVCWILDRLEWTF